MLKGLHELELADDAAYVNLGPAWRIPSKTQFDELLNPIYTTTKRTTLNGVKGLKISSRMAGYEGNSIFLPAAGERCGSELEDNEFGLYWSRTLEDDSFAWRLCFHFYSNIMSMEGNRRIDGASVRPVRLSE